ncbi:MAG: M48 family metalloprotease [Thermoanaerobaculia bacterium]
MRRAILSRGVAATLVSTLLASGLHVAPAAAQTIKDPELFGKSLEAARQALAAFGSWDAPQELERVNRIGFALVEASGYRDYPFSFYLIDMPEPNAFALPGGQIFITRGMLALGLDDDQLAGLLGHEIAHTVLQHGVRMQRRATLLNILSSAALVGVILAAGNDNEPRDPYLDPWERDRSNDTGDLIQGTMATSLVVSELLLRSYSRQFESEADAEGQRWAAAAGFAPDGAARLMSTMRERLPESKEYGYWRTHPFFDSRVTGAEARAKLLRPHEPSSADDLRQRTQAVLLDYAQRPADLEAMERQRPRPEPRTSPGERAGTLGREHLTEADMLRQAALAAWPQGAAAERLRMTRLHTLREAEEFKSPLARDLGSVLAAYAQQESEVRELTPDSPFLERLALEQQELREQLVELEPKAVEVLAGGVYETDFLATFLSNYAQAQQVPTAALNLGNAYARLGRQHDAVKMYLRVIEADPEGAPARQARQGLKSLAPSLNDLAALQSLSSDADDAEVRELASHRLSQKAGSFDDMENGAAYLRNYPESPHADSTRERLNQLADKALSEIILYQSIGDHGKAVDRIHKVLSYAPFSPAADRLREGVEVKS